MAVNPELMAAFEISRSILLPDTAKVETFMKGKVELVEFIVKERSHLGGVSLAELYRKFQIKVLVCAVRRGSEVIIRMVILSSMMETGFILLHPTNILKNFSI